MKRNEKNECSDQSH